MPHSLPTDASFTCPKCGRVIEFTLHSVIVGDDMPDLKEAIIKDEIFDQTCPDCGTTHTVMYPFAYIDLKHRTGIWFGPPEDVEDVDDPDFPYFARDVLPVFKEYGVRNTRRVTSINAMHEKISILDRDLDDVAIERAKHALKNLPQRDPQFADCEIRFAHYNPDDIDVSPYGSVIFAVLDDGPDDKYAYQVVAARMYFEALLAVKLDPRMRFDPMAGMNIDEHFIDSRMRRFDAPAPNPDNAMYVGKEMYPGIDQINIGNKCNLRRDDGSLVLQDWPTYIGNISDSGTFVFGYTKPKTASSPTRYMRGLANINGIVLMPPILERIEPYGSETEFYTAELNGRPYGFNPFGFAIDPRRENLPESKEIDMPTFIVDLIEWTTRDTDLFVRDTDIEVDLDTMYRPGQLLRAGLNADMTHRISRPRHRTRFSIITKHACTYYDDKELCKRQPQLRKMELAAVHHNSYFMVVDTQRVGDYTNIILIQVPPAGVEFMEGTDSEPLLKLLTDPGLDVSRGMIEDVRRRFSDLIEKDYVEAPTPHDAELDQRTHALIGYDEHMQPFDLAPEPESDDPLLREMSAYILDNMGQLDIQKNVKTEKPTFPWRKKGLICEDCLYAKAVRPEADGCGALACDDFRNNVVLGKCPYRKARLEYISEYDTQLYEKWCASLKGYRMRTNEHAYNVVRNFVRDTLGADIQRLENFDFSPLSEYKFFGRSASNVKSLDRYEILKCILTVLFHDVWPGFNYEQLKKQRFEIDPVLYFDGMVQMTGPIYGAYFSKTFERRHLPEVEKECQPLFKLASSLGNYMLMPGNVSYDRHYKTLHRGAPDYFFNATYHAFHGIEWPYKRMDGNLTANMPSSMAKAILKPEVFDSAIQAMHLGDFFDEQGRPLELFEETYWYSKTLLNSEYVPRLRKYIAFGVPFIKKRTQWMIDELKRRLDSYQFHDPITVNCGSRSFLLPDDAQVSAFDRHGRMTIKIDRPGAKFDLELRQKSSYKPREFRYPRRLRDELNYNAIPGQLSVQVRGLTSPVGAWALDIVRTMLTFDGVQTFDVELRVSDNPRRTLVIEGRATGPDALKTWDDLVKNALYTYLPTS